MIPVLLNGCSFRFAIHYHTVVVILFLFIQNKLLKPETLFKVYGFFIGVNTFRFQF